LRMALASRKWPTTHGTVIGTGDLVIRKTYFPVPISTLAGVQIPYEYSVAGRAYHTGCVLPGEIANREQAWELLEKYPSGKKVVVRYNRRKPQEAVLEPVLLWGDLTNSFISVSVYLFILLLWLGYWPLDILSIGFLMSLWVVAAFVWSAVASWHDGKISFWARARPPERERAEEASVPLTGQEHALGASLVLLIMFGPVFLVLYMVEYLPPPAPSDLVGPASFPSYIPILAVGFLLTVLGLLALRHRLLSWRRQYLFFIGRLATLAAAALVLASLALLWFMAVMAANALFDTGPAETRTLTLYGYWKEGKRHYFQFRLYKRGATPTFLTINVSPADYQQGRKGAEVNLQIRPGFFGLPWIAGYELGEAPPPEIEVEKLKKPTPSPAQAHLDRAFDYHHEKHFDRAIAEYNRALELEPANADAYFWRGAAYERTGELDRALADFRQAIALDPDHVKAYDMLGRVLQDRNEFAASVPYFTRAIELEPEEGSHYYSRGRAYYALGQREQALADAQKGCDLGYQPACQIYQQHKNRVR